VNKEPVVGVVYDPKADELYLAVKGLGSYLNGTKLRVSGAQSIRESIVVSINYTGLSYRALSCIVCTVLSSPALSYMSCLS
jgi:fructose-1,6-bisphosphatase/inositol monophosphatase family enzyme